jgi:hypothetical protein
MRVEPTNRLTFGPAGSVRSGTVFYVYVIKRAPDTTVNLNRCGVPCNTAELVKAWGSAQYAAGDELSWRIDVAGDHYLWALDHRRDDASVIVSDEIVGNRLRITFDSGALFEAWYVTP